MIWLLIASLLWGPSFALIPILRSEPHSMNATTLAFFRMVYSLILFLPLLRVRIIARRKRVLLIGLGALQFGGMYVLLNLSYQFLVGTEVLLLTVFTPLYVTMLDLFLTRQRGGTRMWSGVLLAVAGAAVIRYARPDSDTFWQGFLLMQASNLCFALGQVGYRRLLPDMKRFGDMHVFGWMYFGAVLICGIAWLFFGEPAASLTRMAEMPLSGWMILLWLGLIPSGLAFFLFNHGALITSAATLSIFNNLKIPLGMLTLMLVFRMWDYIEDWPRFLIGAALMLIGLALNEQEHLRRLAARAARHPRLA